MEGSLLRLLGEPASWEKFYGFKRDLVCPKAFLKELRRFIDGGGFVPSVRAIEAGERFPLPRKSVISKQSSKKKRVVYTYPYAENIVLKLLTHLLLRKYDGVFSENLYSFRPGRNAKDAVRKLCAISGGQRLWSYKVDISNYFNSVPVGRLLPELRETLADDPELYSFLAALLSEKEVLEKGNPVIEEKGIMAGTPVSAFYANLYLKDLDRFFYERRIPYARYSDDIILFAPSREEAAAYAAFVREFLAGKGLAVNPDKESFSLPEEGWTFLGFSYREGVVDIAAATVEKLKKKMRRKTRALARWRDRNELEGERAAKAFIRIFNRKLLENGADNELTWSLWFFSVINTDASLKIIDAYAQECIRFLVSGKRTKARFGVRYENMKELGYRSLVHEYYAYEKGKKEETALREGD